MNDPDDSVHTAAVSQYYRKLDGQEYMGYSIRSDTHRMIQWRDFGTGEVIATELCDHQVDPAETVNIFDSASASITEALSSELRKTHPPKGLVMTSAIHSNPNAGRWRANISFSNQSPFDVMIYPVTPDGRRGRATKLGPNDDVKMRARIGGVFVVESSDGKIHEIHSPSIPDRRIVLPSLSPPSP